MTDYKIGKFEVAGLADATRAAICSIALIGASVPISRFAADSTRAQRSWARMARRGLGIREDVKGLGEIDWSRPYLIAPLHEGFADVLMLGHIPQPLRFVVRDELLEWRWLGAALRNTNQIVIEPEGPASSIRGMLELARQTFSAGTSLVMFPQGTILGIESGFNRGPFWLADRLEVPVLPVVLTGSHRVWEHPYSPRLRFDQPVSMRVLAPLEIGEAQTRLRDVEKQMKSIAMSSGMAPVRHFVPTRDGYWDGYDYVIDPDWPDLASDVERHRKRSTGLRASPE